MAPSRRTTGVESARKALQLLLCFDASRTRASVAELAKAAGLPLSSAYRHVALLREVGLVEEEGAGLYRVTPGEELAKLLNMAGDSVTFGRTARIHVAGRPAVQLLEIVAPAESVG